MSVDFDVRGQRETFSMEEALLWPEGEIYQKKRPRAFSRKLFVFVRAIILRKGATPMKANDL